MTTFLMCDASNKFVPAMLKSGQFYLFTEMVQTLSRLHSEGVLKQRALSAFVSDHNLKALFVSFEANELVSRMLCFLDLIALKGDAERSAFFAAQLSGVDEVFALLRLCANDN